jgi:hypothetical protein
MDQLAQALKLLMMITLRKAVMVFIEDYRPSWNNYVLSVPCTESHSKASVTNQIDINLWEILQLLA